tara:strand:- start:1292 stop:2059 length:768 start_codon:yes stop_codon:yes gene_type:complete
LSDVRVLQITDLHLKKALSSTLLGYDTAVTLEMVLEKALSQWEPDAILVTGDIAHDEEVETYHRYLEIMGQYFAGPILSLPGNHDSLASAGSLFEQNIIQLRSWQFVSLDSHKDGQTEAEMSTEDLQKLGDRLASYPDKHTIIATHHPPMAVGCIWLDKHRIKLGDQLVRLLAEFPKVKAVVFGHIHQSIDIGISGLKIMGTPSTCFQFEPNSEVFSLDTNLPGYRWLELCDNGEASSDVYRLDSCPYTIDIFDK